DVITSNSCGSATSMPVILTVHTFSLSPNQNFSAAGSPGIVGVTSTGSCGYTAVSNTPFITITSGATGTAPANVGFNVAANTGPSQRSGTLTIAGQTFTVTQDGATLNAVQFNSANYSVQENCTTVTISVNRIGDTSGAASVDYKTSDVTATERKDYITALGSLRFAAGETSKSFAVLINEDSFVEGNETFSITLSNPSGVTVGGPAIATVTITDDASESAANAIDDPQTYVCQHYHDFLNRQPDAAGLQFWTNQITSCGTDQACIEARRINVSASFFLSIEFQDTGYLVERIYKAAYGDAVGNSTFPSSHQLPVPVVRLNEFLSDTQEIGLGVIVGQGNWQQQIENNKQAFTAAFVQRTKFTTAFPGSLTAAQFVDTLNANAGNPLSAAERNQLVNDLSTNAKTRAQVLRAVAEDPDLNSAESNRAFVLMQYFGYLRRNPNDPQDSDHTGYDFWLTKLNQFNGNYINAEMVRAFITSIEYRQRFGQQ
ncbi:MAG TPA: Calx-beta domain-containing protein, partial [Pyrinomonadaceae bacterium]|nr:Calx-beta domain-containing protein [Pyrinomonadaceae bacterium]